MAAPPRSFDEAVIDEENGTQTRLTYEQYFKLPLVQRVSTLVGLRVKFYKAGRQVSSADAMK
jgi:hypothetical protein